MADTKPSGPKADELAKGLKASLAQRRPKPWKLILAALALAVAGLALFAWWMYPRPAPEPMQVLALDAFVTPVEPLEVRAQLIAPASETPRPLGGHKIVFHEPPAIFQGAAKPIEAIVSSNERGQATAEWPTPKAPVAEFQASCVDPAAKPAKHTDSARIFVQDSNTPLLIVDADETLKLDPVDEKAAEKLNQATKDRWQVVYLSLTAAKPEEFRDARKRLLGQAKLPRGPILSRFHAPDADGPDAARRELLESLKKRFRGSLQALVGSASAAQVSKDAGIATIQIGGAAAPAGVHRVASWSDVPLRLK
jgi:hypothetical protein